MCRSRINNTQVDDASYIDVVMPMYNLIEYGDNYLKASRILWQFYIYALAVNNDRAIFDFTENKTTELFNLKVKVTEQRGNSSTKDFKIMVPLNI